jgi:hypothetical protein
VTSNRWRVFFGEYKSEEDLCSEQTPMTKWAVEN